MQKKIEIEPKKVGTGTIETGKMGTRTIGTRKIGTEKLEPEKLEEKENNSFNGEMAQSDKYCYFKCK